MPLNVNDEEQQGMLNWLRNSLFERVDHIHGFYATVTYMKVLLIVRAGISQQE